MLIACVSCLKRFKTYEDLRLLHRSKEYYNDYSCNNCGITIIEVTVGSHEVIYFD